MSVDTTRSRQTRTETVTPVNGRAGEKAEREARLAAALRENLQKRKAQARARARSDTAQAENLGSSPTDSGD